MPIHTPKIIFKKFWPPNITGVRQHSPVLMATG